MTYVKTNWLNAVSTAQVAGPEQLVGNFKFGVEIVVTGGPSSVVLGLEGSINGSAWSRLFLYSGAGNATVMAWAQDDKPIRLVRLNLEEVAGGSSPTVTASVIAVEKRVIQ